MNSLFFPPRPTKEPNDSSRHQRIEKKHQNGLGPGKSRARTPLELATLLATTRTAKRDQGEPLLRAGKSISPLKPTRQAPPWVPRALELTPIG